MKNVRALIVALMLAIVGLSLSACSSGNSGYTDDGYTMTAYGPTVNGVAYCGYVISPAECAGRPGMPYLMPTSYSYYPGDTSLAAQLFLWHLTYHSYYSSPTYYNSRVPVSYRTTYVTNYVTPFDHRYSSMEHSYQSKATYRNSSGRTVTGDRITSTQLNPPRNNGGNSGTKTCGMSAPFSEQQSTLHVETASYTYLARGSSSFSSGRSSSSSSGRSSSGGLGGGRSSNSSSHKTGGC